MTALVVGPNGSGKSAYAERLAARLASGPLVYIATMIPHGEDGAKRVSRHIEQRSAYGFVTLEAPHSVSALEIPANATVLLEDVSNLLANTTFGGHGGAPDALADILALTDKSDNLILVSIGGLAEHDGGNEETREYIRALGELNDALAGRADSVVIMEGGVPCEMARTAGD